MTYQSSADAYVGGVPQTFEKPRNIWRQTALETVGHGVMAGAAGGLAEVVWVTLYTGVTGGNSTIIARGVTTAAGVGALLPAAPAALGVMVHIVLAAILGIALAFAWQIVSSHHAEKVSLFPLSLALLVGVWGINFFVVLPIISPAFIQLLPYPVSLISKLLFGLAAAQVLSLYKSSECHDCHQDAPPNDAIGEPPSQLRN